MKGSIGVKSETGQGSVFTLRLPVQRTAAAKDPAAQTDMGGFVPLPAGNDASLEQMHPADPDQPLLLIIEDNADVVTYIRSCLESGYQILVAENGALGIERALETIPDIILSDVMMPGKDGYEVCHFLKNDERTSHIPIVLLTAKADIASRQELPQSLMPPGLLDALPLEQAANLVKYLGGARQEPLPSEKAATEARIN